MELGFFQFGSVDNSNGFAIDSGNGFTFVVHKLSKLQKYFQKNLAEII